MKTQRNYSYNTKIFNILYCFVPLCLCAFVFNDAYGVFGESTSFKFPTLLQRDK